MDIRIAHLACQYHVVGSGAAGGSLVVQSRLDQLAGQRVMSSMEAALEQALGNDPAVYVFRRVRSSVFLNPHSRTDAWLADRWGSRLAAALLRTLADDPGDHVNLMRFRDQADYVAHFCIALEQGTAWEDWYLKSFSAYRESGSQHAIGAVLMEHRSQLAAIFGYLHQYGRLKQVLAALDSAAVQTLWSDGVGAARVNDSETLRPLFAAALDLIEQLNLWQVPPRDRESLFLEYLSENSAPADWRDRQGLAAAVLSVLHFMRRRGYLETEREIPPHPDRLETALAHLDWLDTDWLAAAIRKLSDEPTDTPELPLPPARRSLPARQRALIDDLSLLLRGEELQLDLAVPDSPANALRIYALLVARAPRWADDPAALNLIQNLLLASALLGAANSPPRALSYLRRGELQRAIGEIAEASRANAAAPFRFIAGIGDAGIELLEQLIESLSTVGVGRARGELEALQQEARPAPLPLRAQKGKSEIHRGQNLQAVSPGRGIRTRCAGVYLLVRALQDARLASLSDTCGYPPLDMAERFQALVLALGICWMGDAALDGEYLDPGLGVLAGMDKAPTLVQVRELWCKATREDHARFQTALLQMLASVRLLQPSIMRLYSVPFGMERTAWIVGDESAQLFPLGCVVRPGETVEQRLSQWLEVWTETAGVTPTITADSECGLGYFKNESEQAHARGREGLLAALRSVGRVSLGDPETDLCLSLTAIVLLRLWARWLTRFNNSSPDYLLDHFIRRSGLVQNEADSLVVGLDSRPLDLILEMAGYLAELDRVPWLGSSKLRFKCGSYS